MDSEKYWADREVEALKHYIKEEKEYDKRIRQIYSEMIDRIQDEINAFYGRYASKEGVSIAEAKKRVSKVDIETYERKAKRYVKEKDFSKTANEEMRLYNLAMKVNRLEMLKANIGLELISGFDELEKFMAEILQGRTMEELKRQAGILGDTILSNAQRAEAIVNASFHNATFSDRIWMYQDLLKADLAKLLQSGLIQGKNPRVLARDIEKRFSVSRYNAERLMRTELARVQTEAQKQSFERMGFEEYTFLANTGCCPVCQKLNGKHFKVKDMMPGKNASPMHPHCRCSTAAYEDSDEYEAWLDFLDKGGTTAEWKKRWESKWEKPGKNIENKNKEVYNEGIPKDWEKFKNSDDDAVKNANPHYRSRKPEYRSNCPNCVCAYEMRKRGYNVIAKPSSKNHYLNRFPEKAWEDVQIIETTGSGFDDITKAVSSSSNGARYEIAIQIKGTNKGHVFIAENKNGEVIFQDPQSGKIIEKSFFENVQNDKTRYWRIDNAKASDRCITSCERG